MAMKNTGKTAEFRRLTASLREFANSLPTRSEKQQLQFAFAEIINFLTEIQQSVTAMPSREDTAAIQSALRALDQFTEQAKTSPAIAALLGISQPRPSRGKPTTYTTDETAAGQQLLTEMQALAIDQMRARLQDEAAVPLRSLQALASQLGIRSVQRMGRDVLVHQVASKISNFRGYQGLRAGTETHR